MGFLTDKIVEINDKEVLIMKDSISFVIKTYSEVKKEDVYLLAEQQRVMSKEKILNLFGGYIEPEETRTTALIRELAEESNLDELEIKSIEYLYKDKYLSAGYTTEKSNLAIVTTENSYEVLKDKIKCIDQEEEINIKAFFVNKDTKLKDLIKNANCIKLAYLIEAIK